MNSQTGILISLKYFLSLTIHLSFGILIVAILSGDGRPDRELADIWWRNHLKRELSIIVALFTGQYKSCMTCAHCGYASARFEPFTFLTLPLPEESNRNITICLMPLNGSIPPIKCSVRVSKDGNIGDVCTALVHALGRGKKEEKMTLNVLIPQVGSRWCY